MPIVRRVVTALTTAAAVVGAILYAPSWLVVPVSAALFFMCLFEFAQLVMLRRRLFSAPGLKIFVPGALILALAMAVFPHVSYHYGNRMLLYLIAIVKFSDMGGFAVGVSTKKIFGDTHRLCPSISPNKSWEGLGGSVLASVLMSLAFLPVTSFSVPKALAFGVVAALVGTFGDLVESKFKRWAGVKDSATFMPAGLGGFLDMVDSLLFAPALLVPFL